MYSQFVVAEKTAEKILMMMTQQLLMVMMMAAECFSKLKLALLLLLQQLLFVVAEFENSAAEFVVEKIAENFVDNFAEIVVVVAEKLVGIENYYQNQSDDYYYLDLYMLKKVENLLLLQMEAIELNLQLFCLK